MALKEEEIQNNANAEDIKQALSTRDNKEECQSSLSQPMERLICSSPDTIKKELKIEKFPKTSCLFNEAQNVADIKYNKEIFMSRNSVEESQNPENQPGQSLVLSPTLVLKEEECSLNKVSGDSSTLVDPSTEISPKSSSNATPSTSSLYNADMEKKSDCEEFNLSLSSKKDFSSPSAPSIQKLRSTKRRAGILYKQLTSNKLCKVTSKYFSQTHKNNKTRWIPPRSPYALVQEDLFDNPWQLLVATIFLTKTTAKKALPQLHKFLARYPRPEDVLKADYEDIDDYFKPLGLTTTRSHIVMRFTVEYLEKDWTYPRELYGIGKYGDDSYRMFCINEWRQVSPDDIPLTMYRNWLLENAERLGIE